MCQDVLRSTCSFVTFSPVVIVLGPPVKDPYTGFVQGTLIHMDIFVRATKEVVIGTGITIFVPAWSYEPMAPFHICNCNIDIGTAARRMVSSVSHHAKVVKYYMQGLYHAVWRRLRPSVFEKFSEINKAIFYLHAFSIFIFTPKRFATNLKSGRGCFSQEVVLVRNKDWKRFKIMIENS